MGMAFDRPEFRLALKLWLAEWRPGVVVFDLWNSAARDDGQRDYLALFYLPRRIQAESAKLDEQAREMIRRLQEELRPEFGDPVSDEAVDQMLRRPPDECTGRRHPQPIRNGLWQPQEERLDY